MSNQIFLENIANDVSELSSAIGSFILKERESFDLNIVEIKGRNDLVSYVDKESEQLLVNGLRKILPGSGFITEEKVVEQTNAEYTWIIDPLDGTTNFVHGLPTYAVSIGLMKESEIILGVVNELNHREVFKAWKGGGSYLNNRPIRVSQTSELKNGLFATGFPVQVFSIMDEYLAILSTLMQGSHGIRRVGSAAVDLAYVACGRYEGFFEYNLNAWDVAAGIILVQEAGGKVTDYYGGDDHLFGRSIIAGGEAHSALFDVIKTHWKT